MGDRRKTRRTRGSLSRALSCGWRLNIAIGSPITFCMASIPTVYLVGAGPGHPGLLTLRAVECLRQADLILYDKLVPTVMLHHAAEKAEKHCVTELAPSHDQRLIPIHEAMIQAARAGRRVVRLKG